MLEVSPNRYDSTYIEYLSLSMHNRCKERLNAYNNKKTIFKEERIVLKENQQAIKKMGNYFRRVPTKHARNMYKS